MKFERQTLAATALRLANPARITHRRTEFIPFHRPPRERHLPMIRHALTILVSCLLMAGCGGSRYPESRFREIEIPADAPSDLRETLDRLNSPEPLTRAHAARQLGERPAVEDAVVTCLLAALQDENSMVRVAAAESLGRIGNPRAIAPLIARMRDRGEDRDVRSRAAEALGRLQAAEAVDVLIAALNDTVWHIRLHAVRSLAAIGDSNARPHLEQTARYDPDYSVRSAAAKVLQGLGPDDGQADRQQQDNLRIEDS
jgi:HEAT repeat protein